MTESQDYLHRLVEGKDLVSVPKERCPGGTSFIFEAQSEDHINGKKQDFLRVTQTVFGHFQSSPPMHLIRPTRPFLP